MSERNPPIQQCASNLSWADLGQVVTSVILPQPIAPFLCYTDLAFRSAVAGFLKIEIWSRIPTLFTSDCLRRKLKIYRHEITLPLTFGNVSCQHPPPIKESKKT